LKVIENEANLNLDLILSNFKTFKMYFKIEEVKEISNEEHKN